MKKDIFQYLKQNPDAIVRLAAKKRLVNFSRFIQPDMVIEPFHSVYYHVLDLFAHKKIKKLIVQAPPQHGKSEGSTRKLPSYLLGLNPDYRIGIICYNASIAKDFNRDIQRIIDSESYKELFPETRLSRSEKTQKINNFQRNSSVVEVLNKKGSLRAVGRDGSLTSKTIDILIMDDLYKNYAEGNSPIIREASWKTYTSTATTRLHNDSQELIVFTRWNDDDLIGRLEKSGELIIDIKRLEDLENIPYGAWVRINFEAIKETEPTELDPREKGQSLWEKRHSKQKLERQKLLDPIQFQCLYQGNPGSAEGKLYQPFKTWAEKSEWGTYIRSGNYTDVADDGDDLLFSACYEIYKSESQIFNEKTKRFEPLIFALITDMEMTSDNTEITTVTIPQMINRNGVQRAWIESNGGGAQFEKTIKKKIKAQTFPFHQRVNKESRIITSSAMVNQQIIMPLGWENRYKKIYDHITGFLRNFSANTHDDPEDGLTGIYEKEIAEGNLKPYSYENRGVKVRN